MKKILLILLLIPFISFGQTDTTTKKYNLFKSDTTFFKKFKHFKKFVSVSRNLSFAQKNYSQLEFGMWKPEDVMRVSLTLDNSSGYTLQTNEYWIGTRFNFELTNNQDNIFFLYLHPKVNNYINSMKLNYGVLYLYDKNKIFNPMLALNFEDTDFILQFGLNYNF